MTTLRIMSYNVRYADLDAGERAWEHRRDAIASAVRFHGADIVGVQECRRTQVDDLDERLPDYRWVGVRSSETVHTPIAYRSTRFRPLTAGRFWLSPSGEAVPGWDGETPRMATYAHLRDVHTGSELFVCNVHLDTEGDTARVEGASLVVERVAALADGTPVVLTGDFNCATGGDACRVITGAGYRETRGLATDQYGPGSTDTGFETPVPGRAIDHIYVSDGIEIGVHGTLVVSDEDGTHASDHLPVITELTLPAR